MLDKEYFKDMNINKNLNKILDSNITPNSKKNAFTLGMSLSVTAGITKLYGKFIENDFLYGMSSDIILPAGAYASLRQIVSKEIAATITLTGTFALEFGQYLDCIPGVHDPLDYFAYSAGTFGALGIELIATKYNKSKNKIT